MRDEHCRLLELLPPPVHGPATAILDDEEDEREVALRILRARQTEEMIAERVLQPAHHSSRKLLTAPEDTDFAPLPASLALPDAATVAAEAADTERKLQHVLLERLARTNPKSAAVVASALPRIPDGNRPLEIADSRERVPMTDDETTALSSACVASKVAVHASEVASIQRAIALRSTAGARRDPLEPSKYIQKRDLPSAIDAPVPRLHAPDDACDIGEDVKKVHQDAWSVPASISSWKNPRGYTIALERRVATGSGAAVRGGATSSTRLTDLAQALYSAEQDVQREATARNAVLDARQHEAAQRVLSAAAMARNGDTAQDAAQADVFDRRLFGRSAGISSGYRAAADDAMGLYDSPMFGASGSEAHIVHRPRLGRRSGTDLHRDSDRAPDADEEPAAKRRTGPVQFERDTP